MTFKEYLYDELKKYQFNLKWHDIEIIEGAIILKTKIINPLCKEETK